MHFESITSAQNPKIRNLILLQEKSKARKEQGLFVVEGRRELEHCIEAGFDIHTVFVCPEVASSLYGDAASSLRAEAPKSPIDLLAQIGPRRTAGLLGTSATPACGSANVIEVPLALYEKIAVRGSTEGIVAEVRVKERRLGELELPDNPLIVVLESVEKPGNLGAVLRSADAAGADAVIVCDPLTDLWNPNLIRASIGAVFTVPTIAAPSAEVIPWLKARGIRILTAQLQDSEWYYETPMTGPTALVMGTESTGLTQAWRIAADAHIRIPMLGRLDSLNVSVSAAILLFEAVRQRHA